MREHRFVGFKNHRVFIGITIKLLGDLGQIVTAHDLVVLRLGLWVCDFHFVVHLRDAGHIAAAEQDFFFRLLIFGDAVNIHGRGRGVEHHIERIGIETLRVDVIDDGRCGCFVELVQFGGGIRVIRCGGDLLLRDFHFLVAEQFLSGRFHKTHETHD